MGKGGWKSLNRDEEENRSAKRGDQALIPLIVYLFIQINLIQDGARSSPDSPTASSEKQTSNLPRPGAKTALVILSSSALVATSTAMGSNSVLILGLSNAILQALAFGLIENARFEALHGRPSGESIIYSASGLLTTPSKPNINKGNANMVVVRDVAVAAMLTTAVVAFSLETIWSGGLSYVKVDRPALVRGPGLDEFRKGTLMIFVDVLANGSLLFLVSIAVSSA